MKKSNWKKTHWDIWSLRRKIKHVIAVIAALIVITLMWCGVLFVVYYVFIVEGFFMQTKEAIARIIIELFRSM